MSLIHNLEYEELLDYVRTEGGIVVLRSVGGIGDAVMISPTFTELKKQYGDVPLVAVCVDYIDPIFRHNPAIDALITFDQEQINQGDDRRCIKDFEDAGCIIYNLRYPCPAAIYEAQYSPYIAKSRQAIFAEACDVKFNGGGYNLKLSEEEINYPKELGLNDRYIMVHLRSHDRWRDYPKILVKALISRLMSWGKRFDIQVITVDSVLDYGVKGAKGFHHVHLNIIMGLVNGAMMLVGPDSSMIHLSGALGKKTLGLFGPTSPVVRMKYGQAYWLGDFKKCGRQYCWYHPCKRSYCMKTIKPTRIVDTVDMILSNAGEI